MQSCTKFDVPILRGGNLQNVGLGEKGRGFKTGGDNSDTTICKNFRQKPHFCNLKYGSV